MQNRQTSKRRKNQANTTATQKQPQQRRRRHNRKYPAIDRQSHSVCFRISSVGQYMAVVKEVNEGRPSDQEPQERPTQGQLGETQCLTQRVGPARASPMGSHLNLSQLAGRAGSRKKGSRVRLVTFREMREIQRMMEMANLGPGSTEYSKPFGSDVRRKVPFGKRHAFRPDPNPGPGAYQIDKADKLTKSASQVHSMRPRVKDVSTKTVTETDAGRYNPHKDFGAAVGKMTIGERSRERAVSNTPPPGAYNPDNALSLTKPKSTATIIRRDSAPRVAYIRQPGQTPDPGQYHDAGRGFGYNTPRMTISAAKQKWRPLNDNPGPGYHDAVHTLTRPRTPGVEISKSRTRRDEFLANQGVDTPAPTYNVKDTFGADLKSKMTLGGKAKWKPGNRNPGPGEYDGDPGAIGKRATSTVNMDKTKAEARHLYLEDNKTAAADVQYDIVRPFGSDVTTKVNFGSKYQSKPNTNPAPGHYESTQKIVRPASKTFSISKTPRNTHEHQVRPAKGHTPSVGAYNTMRPFGAAARKITFGGKYKTQSSWGPSPCDYDPSVKLVKPSQPGVKIHQAQWVLLDEASVL